MSCVIANVVTVLVFFLLLYFPISNRKIEAQIGFFLQTCPCHSKVFEVNVSCLCFELFYFGSYENGIPKSTVD